MRRKDREITDPQVILQIIQTADVCRIAISDEYPYIVPLNYGFEVDADGSVTLYFHSAGEGRKLDLLRKNPQIGFEIDTGHTLTYDEMKGSCSMLYESVMGRGTVEFIEGVEEKTHALRLVLGHYGRSEKYPLPEPMVAATTVYKVKCENLTAKKH